ncbi:hypothetical protein [Caenispirillum bisanense]|uniref:hypothetical protein n=1 Tax=Caenispirillum bisanense TaxID=414052 RepID=UPI0031E347FF
MDRQAIIDDILRRALGSNDNGGTPAAGAAPTGAAPAPAITINRLIVVTGPVYIGAGAEPAAAALPARRRPFGQALRSAAENRRRLTTLGPPRF